MMLISIITVTLNSRRHLEEAIASVLGQDYPELEYILIDGGSTDGTVEIIKGHAAADPRIRWISEPDRGISDAFNKGLARATGEIIGILNSDDSYEPGALAAVAAAFSADPAADVFYGDILRLQGAMPLFRLKAGKVGKNIWREMPLNHPATFVTRKGYAGVGAFDEGLRVAMDYDMVLRLYLAGRRFHCIDAVLARMRYGGESDARFLLARRELFAVTVRNGYPRPKAYGWFLYGTVKGVVKNLLRRLGLNAIIRLHPKFRSC